MGVSAVMIHDVGVAGPHRLPLRLPQFVESDAAVVCVAGMEAALPSIVGGYVPCPVIGVPTSVGDGANFGRVQHCSRCSIAGALARRRSMPVQKGGYLAGLIASRLQAEK